MRSFFKVSQGFSWKQRNNGMQLKRAWQEAGGDCVGDKQPPLDPRVYQHCNQRCSWHSHIYLSYNQHQCPWHTPTSQADSHSFQLWPQPSTVIPLHDNSPVLRSLLNPALSGARWSIPDTWPSPIEIKIRFGSSPNSLETQPSSF